MRFWLLFSTCWLALPAWAAHAYALWGEPLYPPGFAHFAYVNPQAPKGGELRLVSNQRTSTFDKYNPFTIKGSAPPPPCPKCACWPPTACPSCCSMC